MVGTIQAFGINSWHGVWLEKIYWIKVGKNIYNVI